MTGAGILIALAGMVTLWSGYVDANVLEVIDAAVRSKPMPDHKGGRGIEKVAVLALAIFAVTKSADLLGKVLEGAGIGAVVSAAGKGKGDLAPDVAPKPDIVPDIPPVL